MSSDLGVGYGLLPAIAERGHSVCQPTGFRARLRARLDSPL
jgi:hypothetical protein